MNVSEAVATRRSIRSFLDKPVPFEVIQRILEKARMAPSGCNFQPWEAQVLTGAPLKALQERLMAAQLMIRWTMIFPNPASTTNIRHGYRP